MQLYQSRSFYSELGNVMQIPMSIRQRLVIPDALVLIFLLNDNRRFIVRWQTIRRELLSLRGQN